MSGRLPEHVVGPDGLILRRWTRDDAAQLVDAVADSVEHLRPWMPWVAHEPLSVTERQALIESWDQEWLAGGDVVMGVFVDGVVAGGCGLHRRIGPGGLEIGYWTARRFLRQGIATTAAGLLIDAAFSDPSITRVEIHHDQANRASAGVPRKLGLRLAGEGVDEIQAPKESGISCEWRITRQEWHSCAKSAMTAGAAIAVAQSRVTAPPGLRADEPGAACSQLPRREAVSQRAPGPVAALAAC